ncbi:uncharacterized protein LOC125518705 [Triticum urartu]|uniref:uncharacterized protein LOC125518705 n=1 Tax=Triticum urartu TaxID=4572 RepID=UPI0020446FE9|nr:uncharacterized protein LOC125518705 [Triticum urartu]
MAADPQRPRPLHLGQCGSRPATRWRRSGYRRSLTLCHALPPCLLLRLRWPDASSTPADVSAYLCPCATPMEPRCLKKGLETNCPICCDFLFTSSKEVRAVLSGQSMHSTCLQAYTFSHYTCTIYGKSFWDMAINVGSADPVIISFHPNTTVRRCAATPGHHRVSGNHDKSTIFHCLPLNFVWMVRDSFHRVFNKPKSYQSS